MKREKKDVEFQMMHIRIPRELYEKLAVYAAVQDRSITKQVIRFLETGLAESED